jgi:hypothetical protein
MCEKCEKNFTSKQNLKVHGKSCKGHKIITSHKCNFCLKSYSTKQNLEVHLDTCKKKKEKNDLDLNAKIDKLQEVIKEIANKPQTIINNDNRMVNNITIINNLIAYGCEPIDLSLERFDKVTDENYDFRTLTNFRIFPDIIAKFYSNDKGKICSYLSDADRIKIKSINEDCKLVIDDPESMITKYFSKSKVLRDRTNEFINNNDIMFHSNRETINRAVTALSDRVALKKHLKKYKSNFITKNSIIEQPEIQIRFIE